jgi:hypothetical protein
LTIAGLSEEETNLGSKTLTIDARASILRLPVKNTSSFDIASSTLVIPPENY